MIRSNLKSGSSELNVLASDVLTWTANQAYERVYISGFCANNGSHYEQNPVVKVNDVAISSAEYLYTGHFSYGTSSAGGFMVCLENVANGDVVTFDQFAAGYGTAVVVKTVFMA